VAYVPPASARVFAVGTTGSGKTTALRRIWLERTKRALILDVTGEWLQEKGARVVDSWPELVAELRAVAGRDHWRIVAPLDELDPVELTDLLLARGAGGLTYPGAIGGMALVVDELAEFQTQLQRVRSLWRRGRHAGLSIFGASQTPADVARLVTGQSRWWLVCQIFEPRHVDYLARTLPGSAIAALGALKEHHSILWDTSRRAGYLLDPDYKVIQPLE